MRRLIFGLFTAFAVTSGCAAERDDAPEALAEAPSTIINGAVDNEHDAVVAVFGSQSACSATIIHADGSFGYALTAAHCFGFGPLYELRVGANYLSPSAVYDIDDYRIHPNYSESQNTYDFAVLRFSAPATIPVIPAQRPEEDDLARNTPIEHVGYGLVSYPNGDTTQRHHADGVIDEVAQIQIGYTQPGSGPCSGDSGGPNLADTPGGERVAGVISFGDEECSQYGVSGRVSAAYQSFIAPYIGNPPLETTSSSTSTSASAGAGGSGAGAGAGGGWVAGNAKNEDYDGDVRVSCVVALGESGGRSWWFIALAGIGLLAIRRLQRVASRA
jgi:secreted trypsin-like serine protease